MRFAMLIGLLIPFALLAQGPPRGQAAPPCVPGAAVVCDQNAPEDLVVVPGGEWVVATSYVAQNGGIRIINVKDRTSTQAYPGKTPPKEKFDKATYDTCPGPPNAQQQASFQTHGIALR